MGFMDSRAVLLRQYASRSGDAVYIHLSAYGVCKRKIINTDGRGGNATPSPALSRTSRELFQSRCGRYASCEGGGRTAGFCTFVPVIVSLVVGQAPPYVYIHGSGEGVYKQRTCRQ